MSRRKFYGTALDTIYRSASARCPGVRVYIWNPNRTTINDVVLDQETSPRYDITPWVITMTYTENIVFENNEDSLCSRVSMEIKYDPDARPIQITEKTLLDNTPIRIYQGDLRVPSAEWIPVFTGVLRGNPAVPEEGRGSGQHVMSVTAVDRAEPFLNTVVTAKSYAKDTDIGEAAVETAIQFAGLDRAEISFGYLDYRIGHPQSQLVDIEVIQGLAQMLFCVGKKPKFDGEGFLTAADTDIDKAPARVHETKELILRITRASIMTAVNNSVRILGLDQNLTMVVESKKTLAKGNITSGFFEAAVRSHVNFNEDKEEGGRRAKYDTLVFDANLTTVGSFFGEDLAFHPKLEDDGISCFGGTVTFSTGYTPTIRTITLVAWISAKMTQVISGINTMGGGFLFHTSEPTVCYGDPGVGYATHAAGSSSMSAGAILSEAGEVAATAAMITMIVTLSECGRCDWQIVGEPFTFVYQQICATALVDGLLSSQIREVQMRNDWLYDIDALQDRAEVLLKRELIKGWEYEIVMLDDPLLEVDDVIQIGDRKFYITSIRKNLMRGSGNDGLMTISAWRFA